MRKKNLRIVGMMGTILFTVSVLTPSIKHETAAADTSGKIIRLTEPRHDGTTSVEKTLSERRSVRHYKNESISLGDMSQLLWAAQGTTSPRGFRTAPSAGALYPLEIYVVAGKVTALSAGIYKYDSRKHELLKIGSGDKRKALSHAALNQMSIRSAAAVMVFGGVYERTTSKYGQRGVRYVFIEAGHAAQNVFLQAVSLGLGTVVIGAFDDDKVKKALRFEADEYPLYIMPVGRLPGKK